MPRAIHKLTSRQVETLPPGRHSDGGGLYLDRDTDGRSRWLFFATVNGRRREMGLGPAGKGGVPLADVRRLAENAREMVRNGLDPIAERDRLASAPAPVAAPAVPTFAEEVDLLISDMEHNWRNPKHRAQWRTTLGALPYDMSKVRIDRKAQAEHVKALRALRSMPVDTIETAHVLAVLRPIWQAAPETASRVRGRIEAVLSASTARGVRKGSNPAAWRGHLDKLLPKRDPLKKAHHGALPFEEMPEFMARLRSQRAVAALALEFTILTASRTGEVIGATWTEVDLDKALWTIPANRMKARKEHRVPLSARAVTILRDMEKLRTGPAAPLFPGRARTGGMSIMSLGMLLRRMDMKAANVTVHGFRSTFRDWAGDASSFSREVIETALAHRLKDKAEAAYRRSDALEKRRALMEAWAGWCEPRSDVSNVIDLHAVRSAS